MTATALAEKYMNPQRVLVEKPFVSAIEGSQVGKQRINKEGMKRYGNLWEKVISLENLRIADERARKGKQRSYGVRLHDKDREQNLYALHMALKTKTYHTSQYTSFKVYEPKERVIMRLPYYPDRIVHHAIMNVLEPIWIKTFTYNTYSCIKKRGIDACARQTERNIRRFDGKPLYCLKIDIRKFYPSIDHDILKQVIRRKLKDKRVLALLDEIIDSVDAGIPIGNYLSQYLANVYLTYFDHWLKEELHIKHYFRYADDIVILASTKEELHTWFPAIRDYLSGNLKLTVKDNWQIFPVDTRGIDFVGYVFRHRYTLLRKSIKKNLCRRVAKIRHMDVYIPRKKWKRWVSSWWGWCKYCNAKHLLSKLYNSINYDTHIIKECAL